MVPWMQNKFMNCTPKEGVRPFSPHSTFRVWCTDPDYLDNDDIQPDAFGVERCQQEIKSGKYHAIVVVDYSNNEFFEKFEDDFGNLLREFVGAGGIVAFPSSEGMLVSTLKKLFEVQWQKSSYY